MSCNGTKHPLLLERVEDNKIKYLNPPHPIRLLKGEGVSTCAETYAPCALFKMASSGFWSMPSSRPPVFLAIAFDAGKEKQDNP
jgi:hypothetical protein